VTLSIAYILALLVAALVLFAWDVLSLDVVALLLLLALTVPGLLTPKEALAGFGDDTVIVLIALFVLTAGVVRTGVMERLGLRLAARAGANPALLTRLILLVVSTVSSFFSNTVTTAVFLPIAIGSARRSNTSLSKILMPLAFAAILGGSVTLIGSSTNLLVSGQLPRYGLERIGFFEMAKVGMPITILGLLYLLYVAPGLVPDRSGGEVTDRYGLRRFLTEAVVMPGSRLADRTLAESRLGSAMNLRVVRILRDGRPLIAPGPDAVLMEGDVLILEGGAEDILLVKDAEGIEIHPEVKLAAPDLQSESVRMVEAMVLPNSALVGQTLREAGFRERTGLTVLAIHSAGGTDLAQKISRMRLKASDVLLLQGSEQDLRRLDREELLSLEDVSAHHPRSKRGPVAAAIFLASIVLGVSGVLPLAIAFLAGCAALVLTRCLTPEEAYEAVDWRMMVLIACMIAFGVAMTKSGATVWLSRGIVQLLSGAGPLAVMAGLFLLTVLLTQPMSNQAAALVVLPVALQVARDLGFNERTFAMIVVFGASCSFLTPLEPSCVLVYGPGRYRFFDFMRVGGFLTLIVFLVVMVLIPIFWPLRG
jgi:di/tricarboxylate transporter